jgi:hypothetical protein
MKPGAEVVAKKEKKSGVDVRRMQKGSGTCFTKCAGASMKKFPSFTVIHGNQVAPEPQQANQGAAAPPAQDPPSIIETLVQEFSNISAPDTTPLDEALVKNIVTSAINKAINEDNPFLNLPEALLMNVLAKVESDISGNITLATLRAVSKKANETVTTLSAHINKFQHVTVLYPSQYILEHTSV